MFAKKHLIFAAVALAIVVVSVSAGNLKAGHRQPKDGLVCNMYVNLRGRPGQMINTQRICNVPKWNQTITMIEARDLNRVGKGGHAQITRGGLNQKSVTLYFWSQTGGDLNFTMSVFAKPY